MSRRRPGLSAGHSSLSWAARRMDVDAPVATCAQAPVVIERIAHPAIASPAFKCYRVIRRFLIGDTHIDSIEDIGTFRDAWRALAMLQRETWRAQVLDPQGKVIGDNLRTMERR